MRAAPLIAIPAYHLAPGRVARWRADSFGAPAAYIDCLRRAGGRATLLLPGDEADATEMLRPFDGLMLIGGGDVEPHRYGAEPHPERYGGEPDRDELEIALLRAADGSGMPVLAICRGIQVMNVAFGGTLHQHLDDVRGLIEHGVPTEDATTLHGVRLAPDGRLREATSASSLSVSSHHHQGIDRLGEGLVATAWAEDGLVEAVERQEGWMLGVQWHPEETAAGDPAQQALFDALVRLSRSGPGT